MAAAFVEQTGLEAGAAGDLAVRLYAVAAEVYGLYLQADWTWRQCFPQTAAGEYLDLHAALRGVERKGTCRAEGIIRFSVPRAGETARTIPAGTVCMTAGLVRFETTQEATLPAGELSVDAPARALEPGAAGNAAAGTILTMAVAPAGIAACTNPAGFTGGADREDDESLRKRVLDTYRRLANGANAAYYAQSAMTFGEVAAVSVLPRKRGVGTVDVVISTLSGVPGEALVEQVREKLAKAREIAVDVEVYGPTLQTVDVAVKVQVEGNRDAERVLAEVRNALQGWFSGTRLGQPVLQAELGSLIYAVEGVANYAITAPTADLALSPEILPVLGTLTVEEMP